MSNEETTSYPFKFVSLTSHKPPIFKEEKIGEIIKYGQDLNYPYSDYLVKLYQTSPKHSAIINAKTRYIIGGGWYADKSELNKTSQAIVQNIINNANPNETLQEVTEKADKDWRIFGGFALELIWDNGGKKVVEQYHIDFGKVRIFLTGDEKKPVKKYAYLDDWKGVTSIERARQKPEFREWDYFGTKKKGAELFYYKDHKPVKSGEMDAYPLPEYIAACGYIEADSEIQNFHINNIKNQFWGGQVITMTNIFPTEEGQKKFVRDFKNKKTGTDNAGEITVVFANSKEQSVTTTPLQPSDLDKQFDILNKTVRDEIFTAHSITTPLLFGIRTDTGFGGNKDEMMQGYELFFTSYIRPHQDIWENVENFIYSFNGIGTQFKLAKLSLVQQDVDDEMAKVLDTLNTLSPLVANKVLESMSQTEIRALIGLKTITPTAPQMPTLASKLFSSEDDDKIIKYFSEVGETVDESDILREYKVELNDNGEPIHTMLGYKNLYFKDEIGIDLTDEKIDTLSLIKSNKEITPDAIGEALGLTKIEVDNIIDELFKNGLLKGKIGADLKITKSGGETLKNEDVTFDISVKYKYALKDGIPKAVNGSRPFCKKMMALSKSGKVYSQAEIEALKNDQSYNTNAWLYAGGWYTNPDTEETEAQCRHTWKAVIIKQKRK